MPICIGSKEYKDIFVGNKRIRRAYVGDVMVYQYDTVAPVLTVEQPRGLSESAPEYIGNLSNYKIWGYATDASGNDNITVYVNNNIAIWQPEGLSGYWAYNDSDLILEEGKVYKYDIYAIDGAGNKTETITRYVMYDNVAPTLDITAPVSTSTSVPTYTYKDLYTVYGTSSDNGSGVKSVTVNGNYAGTTAFSYPLSLVADKTTSVSIVAIDNAGNKRYETRYVRRLIMEPSKVSPSTVYYYNLKNQTVATTDYKGFHGGYGSMVTGGVILDLRNAKTISKVTIGWPQLGGWGTGPGVGETDYVYGSNSFNPSSTVTSQSWDQIGSGTIHINYDTGTYIQTITISSETPYRYIRIQMPTAYKDVNDVSYYWSRINDIQISTYGYYIPYNEALTLVELNKVDSLETILSNSTMCQTLASNSDAAAIMKENYSSEMNSYIVNNFNVGLNALNKVCGLDYYVFYNGADLSSISGGWGAIQAYFGNPPESVSLTNNMIKVQGGINTEGATGNGVLVGTKSKISFNGYSKIIFTVPSDGADISSVVIGENYSYETLRNQGNLTAAIHWNDAEINKYANRIGGVTGSGDISLNISSYNSNYYLIFMTGNGRWIRVTNILLKS